MLNSNGEITLPCITEWNKVKECHVGPFEDKVCPRNGYGQEVNGYCWQVPCSRSIHHLLHWNVLKQQRLIQV